MKYIAVNGQQMIIQSGKTETVVFAVNNLGDSVRNTEWSRVREEYIECSVSVKLLDVETRQLVDEAVILVYVLPKPQ